MVHKPLRAIPQPASAGIAREWLDGIAAELAKPDCDRALLCRTTLAEILYPQYASDWEGAVNDAKLNIALEPEYYAECDDARFRSVKPLLWLWYSFDRSPLGGQSVDLGVQLRRILAPHIFRRCGENFKAFQHVEFSFGYNLEVGDNVVVHRHVLLDDRGGIVLGNRVSIADYANVYSHTHSILDQKDVTNAVTILDDDVRITYHATILAGVHVNEQGMVGAMALATKDVRPYHVNVGIPAKSVRIKSTAPRSDDILPSATGRREGSS
jgi:acetyltransferase-like isoleucine patch superfamily enzyme